ncbi:MAG: leucyl aminopeptidase [Alphaproteobacteria bacterium]|nr:leucyl aminopeptidase [Alphaproteobacteria bacterium]
MVVSVSFVDSFQDGSSLVVGVYAGGELSASAKKMDDNGEISKNVAKMSFSGKLFETASFISANDNRKYILLVGLGEQDKIFSNYELQKLGAEIYSSASKFDDCFLAIGGEDVKSESSGTNLMISFGLLLKSWRFDKYKTKKDESIKLKDVKCVVTDVAAAENDFQPYKNLAQAIFLTREVVAEPANVIYPETFASRSLELFRAGVDVEVLGKQDMEKLGMNALLGVAQGSEHEPKMVILRWNGSENSSDAPIAFVGKGVTFDSGGISIKPSDHMEDMRHDMAGAGAVLGLLNAVALNKLPINVVGVMPLVENMPSGTAQRPGDIVKSMSGQTIEVLNTDAEGRLILADALWYTQDKFKPKAIIDLATLTGAIVIALGHEFAGLFSNSDLLAEKISASAKNTGEKVWRLPMTEHFDRGIDSDLADVQNCAKPGIRAGSITAAHFLKRFVNGTPWAHIDIAGVEITSGKMFICSDGATGFGVQLLYDFLSKIISSDDVFDANA